jgi:protein translocase SecG subunit
MTILSVLSTILLILSVFIIIIVMLQAKGSGLSIVPGSGDFGKFERRGGELVLHRITIGLVSLFVLIATIVYFIA